MANQITIDIGAAANDGTGDPLRTAFNYVNDNFSNVWNTGLPNSNVQFSDNRILTVNTNANLVLTPNGIGKVVSNVGIVPNMANVHDLGSSTRRWNTIYAQYLTISNDVTFADLTVDGNLTVTGNTIQIGNIVTDTKTIQLANTASTANAANGSGITVGASDNIATLLYNSTGNVWTTNIGISSVGNVTAPYFFGNGSQLTGLPATYANANAVAYGESGWAGNIIPGGNAVYSLGNATNQWNDLYVSNATIFMNNVPISLSAGNVLTVNGNAVLQNNSNSSIATTGNITAGNVLTGGVVSATGNVTGGNILTTGIVTATGNVTGNYFIGNGSQLTGLAATYSNANAVAYGESGWAGNIVPSGNAVYSLGNATNQWNDLYVSNATIFMNNVPVSLSAGNVLTVNGNAVLQNNSNTTISTTGNVTAGNLISATLNNSGNISVVASGNTWKFDTIGNLTLPGATAGETIATQGGYITVGNLLIGQGGALFNSNNDSWALYGNLSDPGATIFIPSNADAGNGTPLYIESQQSNVEIRSGSGTWIFGSTGNLTVPATNSVPGRISTQTTLASEKGFDLRITAGNTNGCTVPGGDLYLSAGVGYNGISHGAGNVNIVTGDRYGNIDGNIWNFGSNGALTLPLGSATIKNTAGNAVAF
jgi:hypothetical protein